jgi:hypothetical protein
LTVVEKVSWLSNSLAHVTTSRRGKTFSDLWSTVKIKKARPCAVCGDEIKKGSEAFSPVTFGNNRMDRIHPTCMEVGF